MSRVYALLNKLALASIEMQFGGFTMSRTQRLALAGLLVATGVSLSAFSFPAGVARCFPIQHMVNVLAGALLGPWYAVGMAFVTSAIRNMIGTGSLLAFPGSMIGALLAGYVATKTNGKLIPTCLAELFGTGVLGALAAWPVAAFVLGRDVAIFAFVIPFLVSSSGGAMIAFGILTALQRTKLLTHLPHNTA